jgi:hypothetical protein
MTYLNLVIYDVLRTICTSVINPHDLILAKKLIKNAKKTKNVSDSPPPFMNFGNPLIYGLWGHLAGRICGGSKTPQKLPKTILFFQFR